MKFKTAIVAAFILLPSISLASEVIEWGQAGAHIDKRVTVEGIIAGTECDRNACTLSFHAPGSTKQKLSVIIYIFDLGKFPPKPDRYYAGKRIQVTGTVRNRNGIPTMVIKNRSSIKVVQ